MWHEEICEALAMNVFNETEVFFSKVTEKMSRWIHYCRQTKLTGPDSWINHFAFENHIWSMMITFLWIVVAAFFHGDWAFLSADACVQLCLLVLSPYSLCSSLQIQGMLFFVLPRFILLVVSSVFVHSLNVPQLPWTPLHTKGGFHHRLWHH